MARGSLIALVVAMTVCVSRTAHAQSAADGFNPGANDRVRALARQADGRIVVGGDFTALGSDAGAIARNHLGRLNADGSIDPAFDPNANGAVRAIAVQADGNILVGGDFTTLGGGSRSHLARLHADGSLDDTFQSGANGSVFALARQDDGRILVGGDFSTLGSSGTATTPRAHLGRLNADGSVDMSFDPGADDVVHAFAIQLNERILVGGAFRRLGASGTAAHDYVGRLMSDGSVDAEFNTGTNDRVRAVILQVDGRIVLGGDFTVVVAGASSLSRGRLVRLLQDGAVDTEFGASSDGPVHALAVQPDGKFVGAGLSANGSVFAIVVEPNGDAIVGGDFTSVAGPSGDVPRGRLARLIRDGRIDVDFTPGANNTVVAMAVQPDGKVLVGGVFTTLAGERRSYLGRLNRDGSLDVDFNPGADDAVLALAVQPDGKILVGGSFTGLGGGEGSVPRERLGRLNPDGSVDAAFDPGANNTVTALALQADGAILVGGQFTALGRTSRRRLGRVAQDGSLDLTFDPGADNPVSTIAVQPDGKILVGGTFTMLGGGGVGHTERAFLGRLLPDGSLDAGFAPGADGSVHAIAIDAGGRVLAAGGFTMLGGGGSGANPRAFLGRMNADGSIDSTFDPGADGEVHAIATQADGQVLVSGTFTRIGGGGFGSTSRRRIARLNADGTVDAGFDPGANNAVLALALQDDGEILVGGAFTTLGGGGTGLASRSRIGRLANLNVSEQDITISDAGRTLTWRRSGSLPELADVAFDLSSDGSAFSALGPAQRIEDVWQLAISSPPINQRVWIRARGAYATGHQNGSSSSAALTQDIYVAMPAIAPETIGPATAGVGYAAAFTAPGAIGVVRFATASALPLGVSLSTAGLLSGAPVQAGTFPMTITATDLSSGGTASKLVTLTVGCPIIVLSSPALSVGSLGAAYGPVTLSQSGGIGAAVFSMTVGSLPRGLSLSSAGVVSGIPAEVGNFTMTARATDSNGCFGEATHTISVVAAPAITAQPISQVVTAGGTAAFTATASGSPAPAVQWQIASGGSAWTNLSNAGAFSGAGTNTLTIVGVTSTLNGSQYRLVASNNAGSAVSSPATLTVLTAPAITTSPASLTIVAGGTATFNVAATGDPEPSYRWQVSSNGGSTWSDLSNGGSYSGVTSAALTVSAVPSELSGMQYRAIATNSVASVSSNAATLTVQTAPAITTSPASLTIVAGGTATFNVAATGDPEPSYRWQFSSNGGSSWSDLPNGGSYSGGTSAALTVSAVPSDFSGMQYRAVATNSVASVSSNAATLTVQTAPVVTTQPLSQTVVAGATAFFSVAASGNPEPSFRWQLSSNGGSSWSDLSNGGSYSGGTSAALTVSAVPSDFSGMQYRAVATNSVASVSSNAATLTVQTAPVMTSQPASQTVALGSAVTFTAAASGNPSPAYRWQVSATGGSWTDLTDSSPYSGTATATLRIAAAPDGFHGLQYRMAAANTVGSVASTAALLTVDVPPAIATQPASQTVNVGGTASFGVTATGRPAPVYQWQLSADGGGSWADVPNGAPYSGASSPTLTIVDVPSSFAGRSYRARASNVAGTAISAAASLTVNAVSDVRLALESPAMSSNVSQSFPVTGWAVDLGAGSGTGVNAVHVYLFSSVDGSTVRGPVSATMNLARPDIGSAFGSAFANAGFSAQLDVVPPGSYHLVAFARSVVTGTFSSSSSVDIEVAAPVSDPVMVVDVPASNADVAPTFTVSGWAVDRGAPTGSGVDAVHVWAFPITEGGLGAGVFAGSATVGLSRPDVGAVLGSQFNNSGYELSVSSLAAGPYRLTVFARSTVAGSFNASRSTDVTIVPPVPNPIMALDSPADDSTVGSSFVVAGWAVDLGATPGPGVDAIHVWAFPRQGDTFGEGVFLGQANYGGSRPDVSAVFGDPSFTNSGFTLPVSGVAVGAWRVVVFARSTVTGTFNNSRVADLTIGSAASARTVDPKTLAALAIDAFDPDTAYAALGGGGGSRLWKTRDAGVVWHPVADAALPELGEAPARAIAIDPRASEFVYVGTDRGLFSTRDAGETWARVSLAGGEPAVSELFWKDDRLAIVTAGYVFSIRPEPPISANVVRLTFVPPDSTIGAGQLIALEYHGRSTPEWQASVDRPWIDVMTGANPSQFAVSVRAPDTGTPTAADRAGAITFTAAAIGAWLTIPVTRAPVGRE